MHPEITRDIGKYPQSTQFYADLEVYKNVLHAD